MPAPSGHDGASEGPGGGGYDSPMGELDSLLAAARDCEARAEPYALATVIAVHGSSYRRAGARLLVPAESAAVGVVSGGCLESEAERLARGALAAGMPCVATIDHSAEGDELWGWGLGCRGAIDLLLEPPALAGDTVEALRTAITDGIKQTLLTVLGADDPDLREGTRLRWGGIAAEVLPGAVAAAATIAEENARPTLYDEPGLRLAIVPVQPPLHLVLCGAGPDAEPLVRLARELGWRTTVADWRPGLLDPARFPGARLCDVDPPLVAAAVGAGPDAAAVLMTHDYLRDAAYLRGLLRCRLAYLGILGPRERTDRLFDHLRTEGADLSADERERLHAPAGLDLAADGPAEVATSIVGEILAVTRGGSGRPLRERPGPIHPAAQPPM